MIAMNDEDLKSYNAQGFIPGPMETKEAFLGRIDYCLKLKSELFEVIPGEADLARNFSEDAFLEVKKAFDIFPVWVPCVFSNYRLTPWQGGCAWIFQKTQSSPIGAFFQLRKSFKTQKTYLKIYSRKELMMHEMAHVGRMAFDEPIYEEFFAYRTAPSVLRRWFGPIVQSPSESLVFVVLLGAIFASDVAFVLSDMSLGFSVLTWLKFVPVGLILVALVRLALRHRQFNQCLKRLKEVTDKPYALMYRLKDAEIKAFSKMSKDAILEKIKREANQTLRQRVLASYTEDDSKIGF